MVQKKSKGLTARCALIGATLLGVAFSQGAVSAECHIGTTLRVVRVGTDTTAFQRMFVAVKGDVPGAQEVRYYASKGMSEAYAALTMDVAMVAYLTGAPVRLWANECNSSEANENGGLLQLEVLTNSNG